MNIGEFVKERRVRMGYTAEQLAEKADCSADYIHKIEEGTRCPSNDTGSLLLDILGYAGVSLSEFMTDGIKNGGRNKLIQALTGSNEQEILYCLMDHEDVQLAKLYDNSTIFEYALASWRYVSEKDGLYLKKTSKELLLRYPEWKEIFDKSYELINDLSISYYKKYMDIHNLLRSKKNQ